MNKELLRELLTVPGVSGREQRIRSAITAHLSELAGATRTDRLGNLVAHRPGTGSRIMLCAHMDTIGFLVQHVDDSGFLRLMPVGGLDPRTLVHQRVMVCGRKDLVGVLSPAQPPVHLLDKEDRKKVTKLEDLFVDVMLPAEEVKELVEVGDQVVILREPVFTDRAVLAPYLDDRLGVYILLETLRRAESSTADIHAVFSVQEEVSGRGASTGTFGVEPDVAVAIDTAIAADLPGSSKTAAKINSLGDGVILTVMDSSTISDPRLISHLRSVADERKITYGMEALDCGGTDAAGMQAVGRGVPVVALGPATRYVHTSNEVALLEDIEATIELLVGFLESAGDLQLAW